jgi:hypothetical protein
MRFADASARSPCAPRFTEKRRKIWSFEKVLEYQKENTVEDQLKTGKRSRSTKMEKLNPGSDAAVSSGIALHCVPVPLTGQEKQ